MLKDLMKYKKNDTVCILGFAPSYRSAPYDRKDVDFWGINEFYQAVAHDNIKCDFAMWFEIHNIKDSPSKQKEEHQAFLKHVKIPLVTQQHWPEYPTSVSYPREEVKKYFEKGLITEGDGSLYTDYSNQIAWMIALAIVMGYKYIYVYGVDMAQESEYAFQRSACQFFIGWALGNGINVKVPETCQLLKGSRDYGFDSDNKNRFSLKDKIKDTQIQMKSLEAKILENECIADDIEASISDIKKQQENNNKFLLEKRIQIDYSMELYKQQLEFVQSMPKDLVTINAKSKALVAEMTKMLDKLKTDRDALTKQAEKTEKEMHRDLMILKIKLKRTKKESEIVLRDLDVCSGVVSDCKHLLARNLV
jgi:hypothetical protein